MRFLDIGYEKIRKKIKLRDELLNYERRKQRMERKYVKPVLQLPSSKFQLMPKIMDLLLISGKKKFIEPFGGTGIVSINIKHNLPNIWVHLNDYDNLFPLTKEKVINNLASYGDIEKYKTDKEKNKLWEKVKKYNCVLYFINKLTHIDFKDIEYKKNSFVFLDPPYRNSKYLYKKRVPLLHVRMLINSFDESIDWALTYNDCDIVYRLFEGYSIEKTNLDTTKEKGLLITNVIRK